VLGLTPFKESSNFFLLTKATTLDCPVLYVFILIPLLRAPFLDLKYGERAHDVVLEGLCVSLLVTSLL